MLNLLAWGLLLGGSNGFLSQKPLTSSSSFPTDWSYVLDDSCTVSKSTAFEQVEGPVNFSIDPSEHPEVPKITPVINSTHWEQWEFDTHSESGMSGLMVAFSRDASYAFFGQGNLRVEFYMSTADGSVIQELDYLSESTIVECGNFIVGTFNSTKKRYSFQATKDMKYVKLDFDSPQIRGSANMTSVTPAHFADGTLWESGKTTTKSLELSPGLFYSQPVAGAHVEVDALLSSGKRIRYNGQGGHLRLWATNSWFDLCDGWHIIRAMAGPYTISYWEPVSRVNKGVKYYAAQLFHNEELVVSSQIGSVSQEDHVLFSDELDGELSGRLADKTTGHVMEFVSPARDQKWRFVIRHIVKDFEMGFGSGTGLSGFANRVVGGEVDGLQYEGRGFSEQVVLPLTIAKWKIWLVFGVGFLQRGKTYVIKAISYFT